MFAPRIAKAQTKEAASSNNKLANQRPHPFERRLGLSTEEEAPKLQAASGNQATGRLLAQRAGNVSANQPADRLSVPSPSWDFSKIPLFPPGHENRPQRGFPLTTMPLQAVIRPKLEIGAVNDPLEAEADQAAERVMRMPEPAAATSPTVSDAVSGVRHKCSCGGSCDKCKAEQADDGHGRLQMKPASAGVSANTSAPTVAPPIVHEVLRSPGQPLDPATRAFFEPRFGFDLGSIRVHVDADAAQCARQVQAKAYTFRNQIVFAPHKHEPQTVSGQQLMAHELAHVVQQSRGSAAIQRSPEATPWVDRKWRRDEKAATYRGSLIAQRIRQHGKLSFDVSMRITRELAYFQGSAREAYIQQVRPALIAMGEVDITKAPRKIASIDLLHVDSCGPSGCKTDEELGIDAPPPVDPAKQELEREVEILKNETQDWSRSDQTFAIGLLTTLISKRVDRKDISTTIRRVIVERFENG